VLSYRTQEKHRELRSGRVNETRWSPFCLTNVGEHTKLKGFDLANVKPDKISKFIHLVTAAFKAAHTLKF
jgi:hypothetical protein